MRKDVSALAVVAATLLGCLLSGVGAFALFAAAMGERWWPALAFAALAIGVCLVAGLLFGRRSRANGWAAVGALTAPGLLLGIGFGLDAVLTHFGPGPKEPGIPVAGIVFAGLAVLFCVPATAGVLLAPRLGSISNVGREER